jgi:methionine-rich copper-binding protein CopC
MKTLPLIVTALAATTMQAALAHTELAETVPADRAVVQAAPDHVQLRFSEPVRLTALSVQKDGQPKRSLGPLPAETAERLTIALPALDDGHYVVTWRALSEDTHVMSGEFMFAVGSTGSHDEHMSREAEHAREQPGHADHDHADAY